LIKQITNEEKLIQAQEQNKAVYCGFDPTAISLHVGHLMMIVTLQRFGKAGFRPIALMGGGTGMIGDPSFKSDERVLQTNAQVLKNVEAIEKQMRGIIPNVEFANNASWLNNMTLIDFLRDVGKDFTLSYLLAKESIATRIQTGLSITEFSYTMLQAFDF
jgi:tyrosyl-tRNA synthetase